MVSKKSPKLHESDELEAFARALSAVEDDLPDIPLVTVRRSALADALIPRVVPSIATYGAYERPL